MSYEQIGYLCIQKYPNRICGGCTSGCFEPVYVEGDDAQESPVQEQPEGGER